MITFLLMNMVVALSAYHLARLNTKTCGFAGFWIKVIVLYFTQIVLTELILGILGWLYLVNVILLNVAILLFIYLLSKNKVEPYRFSGINALVNFLSSNRQALFLFSIILMFGLVKLTVNLINPPFGWDSLNYHFTFPVEWLKHGNLDTPITVSDDPSPTYYPINGSLFYLWLIFPLKNVFLADIGQLPFFILAILATFAIARRIKLNREYAFCAAALFMLVPNYFKQLSFAYVDVMVAALFLTAVFYLFRLSEGIGFENLMFFSLSLGLFLGTKTIALPYGALLIMPFISFWIKNTKQSHIFILGLILILATGGFSYMRNFLETGNPLYPFDFAIFGKTIFKGAMDRAAYGAHFNAADYKITKLLFHEGLGPQTLIFLVPGIFLAPVTIFLNRKKAPRPFLLYLSILPILLYCVWRYAIPLANSRYLYAFLSLGILSGFYCCNELRLPRSVCAGLSLICAIVSCFELAKRSELISSIILSLLLFTSLLLLTKKRLPDSAVLKKPMSFILCGLILFSGMVLFERFYAKNEFPRYKKMIKYSHFWPKAVDAWIWLNEHTSGDNIAYIGRPVPFPLYGSRLKNNVYYVSVNATEPAKLHKFTGSHYSWGYDFESLHKDLEAKGNYRSGANYSTWRANLTNRKIKYLFVYSLHQIKGFDFPVEDKWANENRQDFTPVFTNQEVHIYEITK